MELQPARMSTGKTALGYTPLSLPGDTPWSFPELPGDGTLCLAPLLVLAGSTRDSVGSTGWHGRGGMATVNEAGRCPSMPGLGTLPGWGHWGPWGWLGKPTGSAATSHQHGPKQPHIQLPLHLVGGTTNSFTWCCAHLPKPDVLHGSFGAGQQLQVKTGSHIPALLGHPVALPWPSCHSSAALGEHCLAFTQSSQNLCPEGAFSSCPMLCSMSNPAGISPAMPAEHRAPPAPW